MKRFKDILCVVSASMEDSQAALERAVDLAKHSQANLPLLDVVPPVIGGNRDASRWTDLNKPAVLDGE
jgi:hypothetical protein